MLTTVGLTSASEYESRETRSFRSLNTVSVEVSGRRWNRELPLFDPAYALPASYD